MGKCKYIKNCKFYDKDSIVCNKDGGMYYGNGSRPAGCYRDQEKEYKKEFEELQEAFNIAILENNRLRKKLGYK